MPTISLLFDARWVLWVFNQLTAAEKNHTHESSVK